MGVFRLRRRKAVLASVFVLCGLSCLVLAGMQPIRFSHTTALFESFSESKTTEVSAVQVMPYMMYFTGKLYQAQMAVTVLTELAQQHLEG